MNFEHEIKTYIKHLSQAIPSDIPDRTRLLTDTEHSLRRQIQEHPSASWEEITGSFGTADETAESLLREYPQTEALSSLHTKKQKYTVLLLFCAVCIAAVACIAAYIKNWEKTDHHSYHRSHYILNGTEVSSEEFYRK